MVVLPVLLLVVIGVVALASTLEWPGIGRVLLVAGGTVAAVVALVLLVVVGLAVTQEEHPDPVSRRLQVRSDVAVVFQQCDGRDVCRPPVVVEPVDGVAAVVLELAPDEGDVLVTAVGSTEPIERFTVAGDPAPEPAPEPPPPTRTGRRTDLPAGRVAGGLAGAAALLGLAGWLLHRRPDERAADPFWDVSLDVPEWEGVSVELDDDELVA